MILKKLWSFPFNHKDLYQVVIFETKRWASKVIIAFSLMNKILLQAMYLTYNQIWFHLLIIYRMAKIKLIKKNSKSFFLSLSIRLIIKPQIIIMRHSLVKKIIRLVDLHHQWYIQEEKLSEGNQIFQNLK